MDEVQGQPRDDPRSMVVGRSVAVATARALIVGIWAMLALLVLLFWVVICAGSVNDYLSSTPGGPRSADAPTSVVEASNSLVITVFMLLLQTAVIAGLVAAVPRLRTRHSRHRLPVPSE